MDESLLWRTERPNADPSAATSKLSQLHGARHGTGRGPLRTHGRKRRRQDECAGIDLSVRARQEPPHHARRGADSFRCGVWQHQAHARHARRDAHDRMPSHRKRAQASHDRRCAACPLGRASRLSERGHVRAGGPHSCQGRPCGAQAVSRHGDLTAQARILLHAAAV